ncbi:radical SAM protein [Streptomyces sp. NPDC000594]|uniref:radical SAM/SPASM domain-containing protein n=1 Tax=Streptomyces sp. NPDC000594 TaxID=3154261 RepID=UPI0033233CED
MTTAPEAPATTPLRFLSLELTNRCNLACPSHCYAQAGPTRGHGQMTTGDWRRVITEAATLGAATVQMIGGEPSLRPDFTGLVEHALEAGLRVRVYTNLLRVRAAHWTLYEHPRVDLATSYYSDNPAEHDRITGRPGSHAATWDNVAEAVRRGIKVTVGIVDLGGGQRVAQARAEMEALGVHDVHVDRVRAVGHAAAGRLPTTSALCGRCGHGKAAILPDGTIAPCELARFLPGGSVKNATLASVLASDRWARVTTSIPYRAEGEPCGPDCSPNKDTCGPGKGGTADDEEED